MEPNDYKLVSLAHENNEEAINMLYEKYTPIIIKKSKEAILLADHHGIEINDIIQECYIALDEAIKNFNQNGDATFYTFSMLCIERRITNFIKRTTGKKSKILNDAVTIDDGMDKIVSNYEDITFDKSNTKNEINILRNELTNFEKQVFDLKIKGYSFEEIAKMFDKNTKAIYNAWERIKIKYKKFV